MVAGARFAQCYTVPTTDWIDITVLEGKVTFYEYGDPMCAPKIVSKGEGYVDTGRGHIARNETGAPAKDVTVIIAPVGRPFRGELSAPAPHSKF